MYIIIIIILYIYIYIHTYIRQYDKFIEVQSNLRRKELPTTNHGSNFCESSKDNVIQKNKKNPSILKDDFSSKTNPSIFTSIRSDCSNKTNRVFPTLKSTSQFLPQSAMFHRYIQV